MTFVGSRAIVLVLALSALAGCDKVEPEHPTVAPARPPTAPARSPSPPPDKSAADAHVPAWARAGKEPSPATPGSAPASPPSPSDLPGQSPGVAAALASLRSLQTAKDPNLREVASALERLERASGSSEFHGVRLHVLRRNLQVFEELQQLSNQLTDIQKSEGPRIEKDRLANELTTRMRVLGQQIDTDVMIDPTRSPS